MEIREVLLKFQLMRHFNKYVCCSENTEGFLDSHYDGDNFEQKSVATELIILPLLGAALPLEGQRQINA